MKFKIILFLLIAVSVFVVFFLDDKKQEIIPRESKIPQDAVKMTPEKDIYPPILHSNEFEKLEIVSVISSAGAEDSPFIPDGTNDMYFFFTPDVSVPVEKQVIDKVTGIYYSKKQGDTWSEPERVWLTDPGKLSLDGCQFIQENKIWFCAAREGYTGLHWFTAEKINGEWKNWQLEDFDPSYEVGELHISADGSELYYHSAKAGGKGGYDLYVSKKENDEWQNPENISILNTSETEGWPYLTPDKQELWFLRTYMGSPSIWRSKRINEDWQEPELIVSQFAGEPTFDLDGNLYFCHHYYKDSVMIEADIYVAYKKQ